MKEISANKPNKNVNILLLLSRKSVKSNDVIQKLDWFQNKENNTYDKIN